MNIPRGERYELCRSVHSEANAIIAASREQMIGSTLFLVGIDCKTGEYVENAMSCQMCKRMIINAGIEKVIIRDNKTDFRAVEVKDWIENDDSLGSIGY
jgi:dCMP deaminase